MARTRSSRIGRYGTPAAIGCKMPGKGGFRHTRNSPPTGEFRAENVENSEATWNPLANSTDLGGYRFENSAHSPLGGERGGSHWTAWRWRQSKPNLSLSAIFLANREKYREFRVFYRFELRPIPYKPGPRANLQPSHLFSAQIRTGN